MNNKINIFYHAPKELTTDAFLTWILYYLDSTVELENYKQNFFASLILREEDKKRMVGKIDVKRQENDVDVLLSFVFNDTNETKTVLFEDKTWSSHHSDQLKRYKEIYPSCYRYFYYKLAYINSQEQKEIVNNGYELINAFQMNEALRDIAGIHPLINMYCEYIGNVFCKPINLYEEKLFNKLKLDYDVLRDAGAQKYLCDKIVEEMQNQNCKYLEIRNGTSYGRPWTQIDIAENKTGMWEKLFWRVDIRAGKFYIRLNQYGEPSEGQVELKKNHLDLLRKHLKNFLCNEDNIKLSSPSNKGLKESEIIIFFLEDNDLNLLIKKIPLITQEISSFFLTLDFENN